MPTEDELKERIRKTWAMAEGAPDEIQLTAAVNALVRLGTNKQFNNLITPIMPPPVIDERADKLVVELFEMKDRLDEANAKIARLEAEIERAHAKSRRHTHTEPVAAPKIVKAPVKLHKTKTNFQEIAGDLVNAARMGGMPPKTIFNILNTLLMDFDGAALTPNMLYGTRLNSDAEILPEGDKSPLHRPEIVAMQGRLWGQENNIKPMIRFIITHTQPNFDVSEYMMDDSLEQLNAAQCGTLRTRYHVEMKLRTINRRYEKFSRGFALLPKRTQPQLRNHNDHYENDVLPLAERWFGPTDAGFCIGQLCGYDIRTIELAVDRTRPFPQELRDTVAIMDRLVGDCDPDDPVFEQTIFDRVKAEVKSRTSR